VSIQLMSVSLVLFCIPLGWGIFQLSGLAPPAWAHPFWSLAGEQLSVPVFSRISVAPQETWTALMRLGSYGLVFFFKSTISS
jgi:hypothetical protein